ncbi:uncharacterized protein LOC107019277 [Solanum pennellii]|uniref:Uncharacterized protein LOC107019277 n=1 Tax=Solanum pennellii TaxID=28526 RepID=A0ABM1GSM0_SOLPN|nr:uncharacterized protein LOC107019277 [Solanum pennellii]
MAQGGSKPPACTKYGRNHPGVYREGSTGCFKCGHTRNFMRECPKNKQDSGNWGNRAQSSSVSPPDKDSPKETSSGAGKGTNRLYVLKHLQEHENLPYIVTGKIQVFDFTVYELLDPGASLCFVTPCAVMNFDIIPEQLSEPFFVSTPVGESILVERVYRDCPVSVNHKSTMVDLV